MVKFGMQALLLRLYSLGQISGLRAVFTRTMHLLDSVSLGVGPGGGAASKSLT